MEPQRGLRGFVQRPVGRAALAALAILVTFATYTYVNILLAIPAMLLIGLAVPIWLGLKRLRFLAILGLVILLAVPPIATLVITPEIRAPIAAAASPSDLIGGGGGALMQSASVSPYTGTTSTVFTWTVTVEPQYIPKGNSTPYYLVLYISTCPGATGNSSPYCAAGYPVYTQNHTFANFSNTTPTLVTFHYQIPSDGIWAWQMGIFLKNLTTSNWTFILLVGDPVYNGLEGPVVGDYWATYEEIILSVYENTFVYLGLPFFIVLLIYAFIKRRQTARQDAQRRAAGPPPQGPGGGTPSATTPPPLDPGSGGGSGGPRRPESACPKCGAVVYENETTCWKCGSPLGSSGAVPLPSGPKG